MHSKIEVDTGWPAGRVHRPQRRKESRQLDFNRRRADRALIDTDRKGAVAGNRQTGQVSTVNAHSLNIRLTSTR